MHFLRTVSVIDVIFCKHHASTTRTTITRYKSKTIIECYSRFAQRIFRVIPPLLCTVEIGTKRLKQHKFHVLGTMTKSSDKYIRPSIDISKSFSDILIYIL